MKHKLFLLFLLTVKHAFCYQADVSVCFSPHGNCCIKVIKAIGDAKTSVYVQAYSFTHNDIAEALVKAKKRGLEVTVYIDKGRDKETHSKTHKLRENDVPVILQEQYKRGLAHNKIMIIDDELVITGSFNWTKNALRNEENINFIKSKEIAKVYIENWHKTIIKLGKK